MSIWTRTSEAVAKARTGLWHVRRGGLSQWRTWNDRRQRDAGIVTPRNVKGVEGFKIRVRGQKRLSFPPYLAGESQNRTRPVIGIIADEFTLRAFGPEAELIPLNLSLTEEQLRKLSLDFILVESAWNGNSGEWASKIVGPQSEDSDLVQLVLTARNIGLATVFWNKEDPTHFDDFIAAAGYFDYVFTTDANSLPKYNEQIPDVPVGVLPFAVQPVIHNPVRPKVGFHARDIMFAGMFFAEKYSSRAVDTRFLLEAAEQADGKLEIFARHSSLSSKYEVPEEFKPHVVGELDYDRMLSAYRAYKVTLNVNTVTDSPTMCSRRALESVACGSILVSTPAFGIDNLLGQHVRTVHNQGEALEAINLGLDSDDFATAVSMHRARRTLWAQHTYQHRLETIQREIGLTSITESSTPRMSVLLVTMRPWQLGFAIRQMAQQTLVGFQLVVVTHGFSVDLRLIKELLAERTDIDVKIREEPKGSSLGKCLNVAVKLSDGEVVAKVDDDDFYGPEYLVDQLDAKMYSGADVVGKQTFYLLEQSTGEILLVNPSNELSYARFVMGPTICAPRELIVTNRFADRTQGEDSDWLMRVVAEGASVFSSDRFNYVMNRRTKGHTWEADLVALRGKSKLQPSIGLEAILTV